MKAVFAVLLMLGILGFTNSAQAQEAAAKPSCRDKLDASDKKLETATANHNECMKQLVSKTEEVTLRQTALANADKERLRSEGREAVLLNDNAGLVKENADLRERNRVMEFGMARYSYAVGGMILVDIPIALGLGYLIIRMRKKRPQA